MDQVSQIRDRIDIVSLLSESLTLKKAGRNLKAVCPFHNEKSPSFMVSPERQMWHCFGCGKGGDIYTYLMEYEKIDFAEALRILAKRAGIELVQSKEQLGITSRKEQLYGLNKLAAEYYHYILTKHAVGKKAYEYVKNRGISDKVIETFQLGYSPTGNALSQYLLGKKKYEKEDLFDAGLAFVKGRDVVDFFRGRLMFPLVDHRDNVVGFSGRIMDNTIETSKYINTRETLIYHKGEHFYGLNITKDAIRKAGQVILVEGEFDVLSCFQEGISNVVAVKGTALTPLQVNLIGRYAQKITMCFDGDKAGQEAMKRSLPIIEEKNLQTTVIVTPDGKDPDDALKTNPSAFKMAVKKDVSVYDYLFDSATTNANVQTAEGKKQAADLFLPVISGMTNEIIKEHYLKKLSEALQTSYESIAKELERRQKPVVVQKKPELKSEKVPFEEKLELYLLSHVIQSETPKESLQSIYIILADAFFSEKAFKKILTHLRTYFQTSETLDVGNFLLLLPKELHHFFNNALLFPTEQFENTKVFLQDLEKKAISLRKEYLSERITKLSEEIDAMEQNGKSEEELKPFKEEYSKLLVLKGKYK